jgi:DNA-binding CsgD family transcriptional regulator
MRPLPCEPTGGSAAGTGVPFGTEFWPVLACAGEFSSRQIQVMQAVSSGLREGEIADRLGISPHTVHTHLRRIYGKTHAADRTELVIYLAAAHLRLVAVEGALPAICPRRLQGRCPFEPAPQP